MQRINGSCVRVVTGVVRDRMGRVRRPAGARPSGLYTVTGGRVSCRVSPAPTLSVKFLDWDFVRAKPPDPCDSRPSHTHGHMLAVLKDTHRSILYS